MKEDNSIHPNDTTHDHHEINIFLVQREERHFENYFACLSSLCACFNQQLQQVKPESREFFGIEILPLDHTMMGTRINLLPH